jgi:hypothetical protein
MIESTSYIASLNGPRPYHRLSSGLASMRPRRPHALYFASPFFRRIPRRQNKALTPAALCRSTRLRIWNVEQPPSCADQSTRNPIRRRTSVVPRRRTWQIERDPTASNGPTGSTNSCCSGSEDSDSLRIALTVNDWISVHCDSYYVFITPPKSLTIENPLLPR